MLHPDFLSRPLAHRGLHGPGVPENSMAAFRAAMERGYGIELDVQPAADGTPLVFHDEELFRLTGTDGRVAALSVAEAAARRLLGTDQTISTLAQVLEIVAGRVPVLIEIKDQDGALGPGMGDLPARVAEAVCPHAAKGHPVAVMSFNPCAVRALREGDPALTVGLTSCAFPKRSWPGVPQKRRAALARLEDFEEIGATFVSHDHRDLGNPAVGRLAARGVPVLCWTIRSPLEEAAARRVARNITFEGYLP
ncbi:MULTISPECIES: glycerophosphodiester phosphodiesterase family protein [unclassified Paracoccus (in: a-proteobacteria)]|uniref:glycerophosphodiester phosphodiesterase family protein n=1 Tax=unclassified Paracoccus (in: a-proteobacteria) TaxID=2688777 RepID=UPI0015FFE9DE|nr:MULTISPECIES: glycerophosphodiester phosphodiesterase family protein [unclassified Paracoccus (in: a-proteobacteria)]MBB1491658.1 phosphodiesterase [Paracoccus sp. MC1854]MBB1498334.1 phosphodiesterase [Paracoccus sp. MC1862]QQO44910.1 phosphodiesterase [Paracoccus sp. MC1862]